MMMSPQYDFHKLNPELNEIKSFNFFRMIKPNNPDLLNLQRRLGVCGTKRGLSCRWVYEILYVLQLFLLNYP